MLGPALSEGPRKVSFKNEGTLFKGLLMRGKYRDSFLYSILREEWKEP
jgi:RimJ/RimL family protein N-acetyltransferase